MKPTAIWIVNSALFLVLAMMTHPFAHAQTTERLVMTAPQDGAVLPMQNQVLIEAQFEPPIDLEMTPVDAHVEATRGKEHIVIADGDIRSDGSLNQLSALWDVRNVTPGNFVITVTATAGGRTGSATANVTLHQVPRVYVRKVAVEKRSDGAKVTFSASAHSPAGTAIDEFIWTPGDGNAPTRTKTGDFSHFYSYSGLGATYILWLEVNDVLGGSTLVARDLIIGGIFNSELKETHSCGCKSMTVAVPKPDVKTLSRTYCALKGSTSPPAGCTVGQNPEGPDHCDTGPKGEVAVPFQCTLGSSAPKREGQRLGWWFEVVASLDEDTNDENKCTEGQYDHVTNTRDGVDASNHQAQTTPPDGKITLPLPGGKSFTFTAVKAKKPYPMFGSPDYGADDYTERRGLKRHESDNFRWLDFPNLSVGKNSATKDNEFITFVRGDSDSNTCWCDFKIKQSWTKDGGVTSTGVELIQGQNCSVSSPNQLDEQVLLMPHHGSILQGKNPGGVGGSPLAPKK